MATYEGFIRVDFKCDDDEDKRALCKLAESRIKNHKAWSGYSADTIDSLSWLTNGWDASTLTIDSEFVNNDTRKRLREFLDEVRDNLPNVTFSGELHVDNMVNGDEVAHWSFTNDKMRQNRKQPATKRRPGGGSLGGGWTKKRMKHLESALSNLEYSVQDIFDILDRTEGELPPEYLSGYCDEGNWSRYDMKPYGEIWRGLARRHDIGLYQAFRKRGLPLPPVEGAGYSGATLMFSWVVVTDFGSEDYKSFAKYLTRLLDDGLKFRLSPDNSASFQSIVKNLAEMRKAFVTHLPQHTNLLRRLNGAGFDATPTQQDVCETWGCVIDSGNTELADFFDELGVRPECAAALGPSVNKTMLEWLIEHGFAIDCVDLTCAKEVLDRCRELGVPATSDCISKYSVGTRFGSDFKHKGDEALREAIEKSGDFAISEDGTLVAYRGSDVNVTVPVGVKRIVSGSFTGNSGIVSVELPEGLMQIEKLDGCSGAFEGCAKLESVTMHTEVGYQFGPSTTRIDGGSFSGCPKLHNFEAVGLTMQSDDDGVLCAAFGWSMKPIACMNGICVFPEGVKEVTIHDFANCETIVLPTTASQLGSRLGYELVGIEVTEGHPSFEIFDGALIDRSDLIAYPSLRTQGKFVVPAKVTTIAGRAFMGCRGLDRMVFEGAPKRIGKFAFFGSDIDLVMPAGVPELEDGAFQHFQGRLLYLGGEFFLTQKAVGSDFECECTLMLPNIAISDVPAAFKLSAAVGFMELAMQGRLDPSIEESYGKYIASQKKKLYGDVARNEAVAAYMLNEAVVPKKDIEVVAELARQAGNDELVERLAEYAKSPKKKTGWQPEKPAVDSYMEK